MKDIVNIILTAAALAIPAWACYVLGNRLKQNQEKSWQSIVCFSGLIVTTSLLLLLVAGQIEILRYGETQINRKLQTVEELTEQNRRLAKLTAELVISATEGLLATEEHDSDRVDLILRKLLEAAEVPSAEIERIMKPKEAKGTGQP